jgi:hypothetical protein
LIPRYFLDAKRKACVTHISTRFTRLGSVDGWMNWSGSHAIPELPLAKDSHKQGGIVIVYITLEVCVVSYVRLVIWLWVARKSDGKLKIDWGRYDTICMETAMEKSPQVRLQLQYKPDRIVESEGGVSSIDGCVIIWKP